MASNVESFSINIQGDLTEERYAGIFKTKVRLSHRDQLRQDEVRRELIGKGAENASPRAQNQAEVFSTLVVHIVDSPEWWKATNSGLDLEDDNVVGELYKQVMEIKVASLKKLKADGEAAAKELAKDVADKE